MVRLALVTGSILAGLAVAIGAFGAHALHELLQENQRADTFETATQYHIFHALALLIVGVLQTKNAHKHLKVVSILFLFGTLVFSGSLYLLSVTNISFLGAITPVGGLMFLAGWILLAWHLIRSY